MIRLSRLVVLFAALGCGLAARESRASDVHFGISFAVPLPNGAIGITVGNSPYYYHHGSYYRPHPHGHGYYAVPPPMGAYVPSIPSSYVGVVINGATYFHNGAVYYQFTPGGYRVSPPPPAATPAPEPAAAAGAPAPAAEATPFLTCRLGREQFLYKEGIFLQKSPQGYVTVEAPIGALAKDLPAGSVSVWIDGQEYFESHNVLFKLTRDGFIVAGPYRTLARG